MLCSPCGKLQSSFFSSTLSKLGCRSRMGPKSSLPTETSGVWKLILCTRRESYTHDKYINYTGIYLLPHSITSVFRSSIGTTHEYSFTILFRKENPAWRTSSLNRYTIGPTVLDFPLVPMTLILSAVHAHLQCTKHANYSLSCVVESIQVIKVNN